MLQGGITVAVAVRQGMSRGMSHTNSTGIRTQLNANSLAQFVDPLPRLKIAEPTGHRPSPDDPKVQLPYYRIAMQEFEDRVHRDLKPTRLWGYASASPGPTFETRSGQGLLVEWVNELPEKHLLPIDHTLHGAEQDKTAVRTVVHLHGGKVPAGSDGYPENWIEPGKSALCHYPNHQEAGLLWYHDHAMGINRLNVFAGLLGLFFVRDEFEDALNLPRGQYEVPLIIYDRIFDRDGQLFYPVSDDPKAPWTPEVFGDAVLVNGKLSPYLEVEPRRYRLRVLNGANGRFFHLTLSSGHATSETFHQIGTDQGLLPAPVPLQRASLAPGERVDLVVDFAGLAGSSVVMKNSSLGILQFRVSPTGEHDTSSLPQALRPIAAIPESSAVKTRSLTLMEIDDLLQRPVKMLLNGTPWSKPVTETPALDSVEIWNFINLTDDSHPIHLHLVRFRILDRRAFSVDAYRNTGAIKYIGPVVLPEPSEAGWKDTVRAEPGMVTRIIIRFSGFAGRYVWHCHILEHEDNEMMRPFDVIAP